MKYAVKTIYDDYDCEDCGSSYAEGFEIYRGNELVHTMKPVAHCLGGEFYTTEDWAAWIIRDLGGEVWIDGWEAALDEATVAKGGANEPQG